MLRQWSAKPSLKFTSSHKEPEEGLEPPLRILVADDQPEMRRLIRGALVRDGYEVVEVANGPALIHALISGLLEEQTRAPDLIITDVRMPGMTGLEVLARLRREAWSIPFILITAFGDEALHREAERLGAARVLDKPFELAELRAAVRRVLKPH
ncbi:response regulator [Hyalangium minutum]|uniref:Response regulator n=1 Tax=Hyalangium minutum TaxID=394096 RepID=A0A085WQL1_9BACT|nr:response regulator [Hyalangium minutum]